VLSLWSAADAEPTVTDDVSALEPEIDGTDLVATFSPSIDEDTIISGNADLWTAEAGYNQDLGIFVSVERRHSPAAGLGGKRRVRRHLFGLFDPFRGSRAAR
jgi:hypothetical protein